MPTEAEDAAVVWRCREEIRRLKKQMKPLEDEMKGPADRLKQKTGTRQAGNFRVEVESGTREGYVVPAGAVVTLDVVLAPVDLKAVGL